MDMTNPKFSEAIYQIMQQAQRDSNVKQKLIDNPKEFLSKQGINLEDHDVTVEAHEGYQIYFQLTPTHKTHKEYDTKNENTVDESFKEQHFMDCHHV